MNYETVIGLEVHVELSTKTKLFCNCENKFGAEPNTLVCPVCLGMPGTLPVVNESAVDRLIQAALALNCTVATYSKFDRKNYFYPDMPKNYQISQYDLPLAKNGFLEIDTPAGRKKIGITRIHLEEDTGKSIHAGEAKSIAASDYTLLNYNRAGVPLLEIVSEPDIRSPEEAYQYLVGLKKILSWIGVSNCKMEEGSLRCDANISIRSEGESTLGVKTEIKNMNSFKSVKLALAFEEKRQREALNKGESIVQETRGWEEGKGITISMRSKEEAHDYRYFPDPDLPPLIISPEKIKKLKESLPELPEAMAVRFINNYGIPAYDAGVLTSYRSFAEFFEAATGICGDAKAVSNWMMSDVSKYLNERGMEIYDSKLSPSALARMIKLISNEVISGKIGKQLIEELLEKGGEPETIVEKKGWRQMTCPEEIMPFILTAIDNNPAVLKQYLEGKETVRQFFAGQVMKLSKGKASPTVLNKLLDDELKKRKEGNPPT